MKLKYYYLKIGKGNELAKEWLNGNNPLKKPAAVIFFGKTKVKELLKEKGEDQAAGFCKAGLVERRKKTIAVVISEGKLWLLKPKSNVKEVDEDEIDVWKAMEVKIISKPKELTEVPPVLASIGCNRHLSGGTFREIKSLGNIKAIRMVINGTLPPQHFREKYLTNFHLFECLSSVELETLIAKLFESVGCFVPAYRGGYMKDIDLFATNDTKKQINLDGILIKPGQTISIQIKTKLGKGNNIVSNYFIALDAKDGEPIFNANWLIKQVKNNPSVFNWLSKSLSWLPKKYLEYYDIKKS